MSLPLEPSLELLPNPLARYFAATRPAFLIVTLVGSLLGIASAAASGLRLDLPAAAVALVFALVAHAGVNVLNDYFDARNGTDAANTERLFPFTGGSRFIQNGVLSERATGVFGYALLASVVPAGLWLTAHSSPELILVGLLGLVVGWAYSAPPLHLVSRGLGEIAIICGWTLIVVGTDLVQRGHFAFAPLAVGLAFALLVANVLYVNQFPDARADARAGKRTLVVRLGPARARWGYAALAVLAGGWVAGCVTVGALPPLALVSLLPLALSGVALRTLWSNAARPAQLRPALKFTILAAVAHGLLLAAATATAAVPDVEDVARLGATNGEALACGAMEISARARQLMIEQAPRTAEYGTAFEQATQRAYAAQLASRQACPQPGELALRVEQIAVVLRGPAGEAAPAPRAGTINPRYLMIDTHGRMVSNEDFAGRYQLLTFGYTFCPDVCPTTLANMAQIRKRLGPLGERLQLVFITLDPQRDDPHALDRYTAYFDAQIVALSGSTELTRAIADHFQIQYRRFDAPGRAAGNYSIDHTAGMYLLGTDGGFLARFAFDAPATDTAARIAELMHAAAAP